MRKPVIPPNRDPYYPDAYHIADHMPEIVKDVELCEHCRRDVHYCNCP